MLKNWSKSWTNERVSKARGSPSINSPGRSARISFAGHDRPHRTVLASADPSSPTALDNDPPRRPAGSPRRLRARVLSASPREFRAKHVARSWPGARLARDNLLLPYHLADSRLPLARRVTRAAPTLGRSVFSRDEEEKFILRTPAKLCICTTDRRLVAD